MFEIYLHVMWLIRKCKKKIFSLCSIVLLLVKSGSAIIQGVSTGELIDYLRLSLKNLQNPSVISSVLGKCLKL